MNWNLCSTNWQLNSNILTRPFLRIRSIGAPRDDFLVATTHISQVMKITIGGWLDPKVHRNELGFGGRSMQEMRERQKPPVKIPRSAPPSRRHHWHGLKQGISLSASDLVLRRPLVAILPPPGLKVNVRVRKTSSDLLSRRFQLSD